MSQLSEKMNRRNQNQYVESNSNNHAWTPQSSYVEPLPWTVPQKGLCKIYPAEAKNRHYQPAGNRNQNLLGTNQAPYDHQSVLNYLDL